MPQTLKKLLLVTLLCGLLLLPLTVYAAQEETTPEAPVAAEVEAVEAEETPEGPIGLSSLVFLLGALAIVTVGGLSIARNNFNEETNAA